MQVIIESINDLSQAANMVLTQAGQQKVFLFYGEMGAGKTTLIKELCRQLGVQEQASSPTFSIVNEYQGRERKVYHFDFYRLKNQTEALDMGYEEYFYSGDYCFVEWPEKIADLLPEHYTRISLTVDAQQVRHLGIENT
ncbi:tRNA (adenosine(37)-N6)-threonylcarbamoyltransferase complex ATPase subunit type 1 TsaE [Mucilaginibacter koreensis]